jgi:excisionase family DNA binding protein
LEFLCGPLFVVQVNITIPDPGQTDQPYFQDIDQGVTIFLMKGYTLREAAQALGVSAVTIRRYVKSGKLKARLVPSKFGESYVIEELPTITRPSSDDTQSVQPLINRIEQLSQEVGYWKAKAEMLQERLLLLEAPKQTPKQKWWQRLFRPWH